MPPGRALKRQTKISFSPAPKSSPRAPIHVSSSDDDDDGTPSRPSKRRRLENETRRGMKLGMPVTRNGRGMFGSSDPEVISSDSSSEEQSEEEIKVPPPRKSRRHAAPVEESDDEEAVPPRSQRQRIARRKSTPEDESDGEEQDGEEQTRDYSEEDDLREDLAFLRSSPLQERGKLRSTQAKPKSEREKALEALKKRRADTGEPSSSATPGRSKRVVIDSESDSELEIIEEEQQSDVEDEDGEEDDEEEEDDANGEPEYEPNALDVFQENNDDADFIDDDSALIGAPAEHSSMPLQFSSLSSAKPRELFKYAVEWMVQKKINPAFSSDDEIYKLTFKKLNDEVSGLANSKFASSVWTADFTRAIKARPDMTVTEISKHVRAVMALHCEACNRKNHTASWDVSFTGKPYHEVTLEPLHDDDSESESDDSDSSALSSRESEASPESKTFALGSTCKANAQVAHTLYHWRYHLNSWVVDYLVREGHCTPEKLVKRDQWSVRKREKYAHKIVDQMEEVGEIRKLHRLYKEQVDFALEAKNEYHRGWGRREG